MSSSASSNSNSSMSSNDSSDSNSSSISSSSKDEQDKQGECIRNRSNFSIVKSFHMIDKKISILKCYNIICKTMHLLS